MLKRWQSAKVPNSVIGYPQLFYKLEEIMEQIEITDDALPILKSGIALKEKLLTVKAENYIKRLKSFEKKPKMKS